MDLVSLREMSPMRIGLAELSLWFEWYGFHPRTAAWVDSGAPMKGDARRRDQPRARAPCWLMGGFKSFSLDRLFARKDSMHDDAKRVTGWFRRAKAAGRV